MIFLRMGMIMGKELIDYGDGLEKISKAAVMAQKVVVWRKENAK